MMNYVRIALGSKDVNNRRLKEMGDYKTLFAVRKESMYTVTILYQGVDRTFHKRDIVYWS